MMNALRLNDGVEAASFPLRTGLDPSAIATRVAQARARNWLLDDPARLAPSELGRRYLNDVVASFLPETPS
jgi:oxygen-independent coproporphyrinogen-3 oxidase